MAIGDGAASLGDQTGEVGLAVRLPLFAQDPVEGLIAIVDVRLQTFETVRHFPADTILDVLVTLRLRQAGSGQYRRPRIALRRENAYLSNER